MRLGSSPRLLSARSAAHTLLWLAACMLPTGPALTEATRSANFLNLWRFWRLGRGSSRSPSLSDSDILLPFTALH